ncbi:MAG: FAD-dependent oxidoreductase [Bacillota bacterium]|nr:FAD-dependent oxidoreductase [Bacillota bacterium]
MADYEHVFTPIKVGNVNIKNRIEVAPMMPMIASNDCGVGPEMIEWTRALARGGAGLVTLGDTCVSGKLSLEVGHVLTLGFDRAVNDLNKLVETIKRYGACASIEVSYHVADENYTPTQLTGEEIKELIDMYALASVRALHAGMDMILIHAGHGHFISQFLSPYRNKRTDNYGGSFENRARFLVELLDAIRDKVGDELAIAYRISGDELIPEGLHFKEQFALTKILEDRIDILHVSAGKLYDDETLKRMFQPIYLPRGLNVYLAEKFKKELKIPITTVGGMDLNLAEEVITEGKADMVAMARGIIADPDCVNKARSGQKEKIRPCVRCNTCIDRAHSYYLSVRCAVNPVAGREVEYMLAGSKAAVKKKIVVIGGGPAGMEAARRAAKRGHSVVLFEKDGQLGGNLHRAASMPFKDDMKKYLQWAIRETMNAPGVQVKLSTEATPEKVMAEQPDGIIVAAGSIPIRPDLPGMSKDNVVWAGDVDTGDVKVGENILVAGAGLIGSETALYLAQTGKKMTMIDMRPIEEVDKDIPFFNVIALRELLAENGVVTKAETKLEAFNATGVTVKDKTGKRIEIPCDTVVLSLGMKPRQDAIEAFVHLVPEVYIIGDCNNERGNLYKAVSEGFFAGMDV